MSRVTACLATAGALLGGLVVAVGPTAVSTASDAAPAASTVSHDRAQAGTRWSLRSRFARETVHLKNRDRNPRDIEHVTELQYRLRWVGAYDGRIDGYFDRKVRRAVSRFQRRVDLQVTGIANHKTWAKLIPRTVKARGLIPRQCKAGMGWHICYDRYRHQVTLWRRGNLRNSWLVRGGARGYETRTGDFRVFLRDKDHVSSIYGTAMPYSQFFSGGQAFHGSPFMIDPWKDHSAGCVNMYIEDARQLWALTHDEVLRVHVRGQWDRLAGPAAGTRQLDIFG